MSSVHVAGSSGQDGQTAFLDLASGTKGCTETLRIPGQGTSTLLQIGKTMWFKPSYQMWKWMAYGIPAAARRHLEGKYLQTSDVPAGMSAFCSPGQLASAFGGQLKDLAKGKVTTISGQPALQLADCVEVLNLVSGQYQHVALGTHANKQPDDGRRDDRPGPRVRSAVRAGMGSDSRGGTAGRRGSAPSRRRPTMTLRR